MTNEEEDFFNQVQEETNDPREIFEEGMSYGGEEVNLLRTKNAELRAENEKLREKTREALGDVAVYKSAASDLKVEKMKLYEKVSNLEEVVKKLAKCTNCAKFKTCQKWRELKIEWCNEWEIDKWMK